MNRLYLLLIALIFASTSTVASVQINMSEENKRKMIIQQIDATLEKSVVLEFLRICYSEMDKAVRDGSDLPSRKYYNYNTTLKTYLQYRWFIADTGLSKKWLSDIQKLMQYMYKTKDIIQTCTHNNQTRTAKYKQAVKYYDIAYGRFVNLIKKPVKVSGKVQRKAKLNKALWQKAMRKKYKIDKKSEADFL
jgi:hypothetical protein